MAYRTTLPTRTDADLGLTKLDRTTVIDPYRDHSATQINRLLDDDVELFQRMGLADGSTPGSYEERVVDLETAAGNFLQDPDYWFFKDDFDQAALDTMYWDGGGLSPPGLSDDPPGMLFTHSVEQMATLGGGRKLYYPTMGLHVRCRFRILDEWLPTGTAFKLGWWNEAYEVACVEFRRTDFAIKGVRSSDYGGGTVVTHVGTWAQDTSYLVDFWIGAGNHLWVKIDDADPVDCGAIFGNPSVTIAIYGAYADSAPGTVLVSGFRAWGTRL